MKMKQTLKSSFSNLKKMKYFVEDLDEDITLAIHSRSLRTIDLSS